MGFDRLYGSCMEVVETRSAKKLYARRRGFLPLPWYRWRGC